MQRAGATAAGNARPGTGLAAPPTRGRERGARAARGVAPARAQQFPGAPAARAAGPAARRAAHRSWTSQRSGRPAASAAGGAPATQCGAPASAAPLNSAGCACPAATHARAPTRSLPATYILRRAAAPAASPPQPASPCSAPPRRQQAPAPPYAVDPKRSRQHHKTSHRLSAQDFTPATPHMQPSHGAFDSSVTSDTLPVPSASAGAHERLPRTTCRAASARRRLLLPGATAAKGGAPLRAAADPGALAVRQGGQVGARPEVCAGVDVREAAHARRRVALQKVTKLAAACRKFAVTVGAAPQPPGARYATLSSAAQWPPVLLHKLVRTGATPSSRRLPQQGRAGRPVHLASGRLGALPKATQRAGLGRRATHPEQRPAARAHR